MPTRTNRSGLFLALFAFAVLLPAWLLGLGQDQPTKTAEHPDAAVRQSAIPKAEAPRDGDTGPESVLRLGAGDLLEVSVYGVPELTTKARVSTSGDVYLPLVDYVHLAGLSLEEAQALIEKRLSDGGFVKEPHVSIFVSEYASQGVSVLGEVGRPGVYPVLGERRLLDLISAAGGLNEKAGRSITVTHSDRPDNPVTLPLARNITDGPDINIKVFPGDIVFVRKADIVYVVGEVGRPSGLVMEGENLTVLKAVALAGGTTRMAKLSGVRIIRKGPNGMSETPIELKKILQAKAPDVPMQAEDILFVPSSARKVVTGRTLEAAMQAATAVSIFAIHP